MAVISLLSDFGDRDNFTGVMKAVILKINPGAKIVDLCHNINPQNIAEAAFILERSFKYFPKDTVHLAVVDPGVGSRRKKILVKTKNYFFVAPDNGILSLVLKKEKAEKIVKITNDRYFLKPVSATFHGRDIFAPVAAYVSLGKKLNDFGRRIKRIKCLSLNRPERFKNKLQGEVIYIDRFGNLITNIREKDFRNFLGGSRFKLCIGAEQVDEISHSYQEAKKNKPLAIFDSFGNLEISFFKASARKRLLLDRGTPVWIIKY